VSPEDRAGEPRSIRVSGPRTVVGVWLEDAPGSRVERSSLLVQASEDSDDPSESATGIYVVGDAQGTEIDGSRIEAAFGDDETVGVVLEECAGASPSITDNIVMAKSVGWNGSGLAPFDPGAVLVEGIRSRGDCHPEIAGNGITAAGSTESTAVGVRCAPLLGIESRCRLIENAIRTTSVIEQRSMGSSASGTGVICDGCAEVRHNAVRGVGDEAGCVRNCETTAVGLVVSGSDIVVDGNLVTAGRGGGPLGIDTGTLTGIVVSGSVRLENNIVDGGGPASSGTAARTSGVAILSGTVDVHSNDIAGGSPNTSACGSPGIALSGANQAIIRNNIISGGTCGAAIEERSAASDPAIVENNALESYVLGGPLYIDLGGDDPRTAEAVNDLPDIVASGNIVSACEPLVGSPCVNAGTSSGVPASDREGDPRSDGQPDIGSDELAPSACDGVACSGHGSCRVLDGGASCDCDHGFEPGALNPLTCDDIDECAVENGGCDPLTQCTNQPGTRTCGACPQGYSGNGEVGCTPAVACNPNPCQRGANCFEEGSSYVCDCPSGTFGRHCERVFTSLAVGLYHQCGVLDDGSAHCWGDNGRGEASPPPVAMRTLAASSQHTCGIRTDGTLACFGDDSLDQASPPAGTFEALAVSDVNGCAVKIDGTLACWGYNAQGQSSPPAGAFTRVSVGGIHGCALRGDGTAACWGSNADGQATPPSGTFQAIAAGERHSCALRSDDTLACWGSNQAGRATPPSGAFASLVSGPSYSCALRPDGAAECWGDLSNFGSVLPTGTFSSISAGNAGGCGLRANGRVDCWGANAFSRVPGGAFREIAVGCGLALDGTLECDGVGFPTGAFAALGVGGPGCAIRTDHTLACWGNNFYGESDPPAGAFDAVALSQSHRCAIRTDGTLACWGSNGVGESIPPSGTFVAVAAGGGFSCGIRTDETLDCWGYDGEGQATPPFGAFRTVAARHLFACALEVDGTPLCWGRNDAGQLDAPDEPFTDIVVGDRHACALRADGSIACWGDDTNGQASPPSGAFLQIAASAATTCALRPDRTDTSFGSTTR
jgi:alpha-tubulin suppressor-like RCC1 family protein